MRRYVTGVLTLALLYALIVLAYFLFAIASINNTSLAVLERKLNPSTFVFWQGGHFFVNPPLFSETMNDPLGQLSEHEPESLQDIDIFVLLLEGPDDIRNVELASQLGLDVNAISQSPPGNSVQRGAAQIRLRAHPMPVYVSRKKVLVMDAKFLRETYRAECLDDLVYRSMINQRDQELWQSCKRA